MRLIDANDVKKIADHYPPDIRNTIANILRHTKTIDVDLQPTCNQLATDCISRKDAIEALNDSTELLRRVLDDTDVVGTERAKFEWGLGLIESCIYDMEELPSAQLITISETIDAVEVVRCKDCVLWDDAVFCFDEQERPLHYCHGCDKITHAGFFCANGERRTE